MGAAADVEEADVAGTPLCLRVRSGAKRIALCEPAQIPPFPLDAESVLGIRLWA